MAQVPIDDNTRMSLRIPALKKALIMRAVAMEQTTMTDFAVRNAVEAAIKVIDRNERVTLSERYCLRVLELLENPPAPNAALIKAANALPKQP